MNVFKETVPPQCFVHMSQDKFRKMLHTDQSKRLDELCHKSLPYVRSQREELGQKLLALRTACWFLAVYTDATTMQSCNNVFTNMYVNVNVMFWEASFFHDRSGANMMRICCFPVLWGTCPKSPWGPRFLSVCIRGHARLVTCWKGRQTYTTWSSGLLLRRRILNGSLEKVRNALRCSRNLMMSTMAPPKSCWREKETSSLSLRMVPALVQVIPQSWHFDKFAILLNCQG